MHGLLALRHSRHERFDLQFCDGAEVLDVCGEQGKVVLDGGGGDERIARLQLVAQGERLHKIDGSCVMASDTGSRVAAQCCSIFFSKGTRFETHWVENIKTGQRVEFKTKFPVLLRGRCRCFFLTLPRLRRGLPGEWNRINYGNGNPFKYAYRNDLTPAS